MRWGRTDKAVVLKQIYEDYDYAAENLPAANNNSGATRVDKGTAYAYKARTALYQHCLLYTSPSPRDA